LWMGRFTGLKALPLSSSYSCILVASHLAN
jgi:hypothetical protein